MTDDFSVPIGATIEDYRDAVCFVWGLRPDELHHRHRKTRWASAVAGFLCRKHPTWTLGEIAVGLGVSVSRIHGGARDVDAAIKGLPGSAWGPEEAARFLERIREVHRAVEAEVNRRNKVHPGGAA